MLGQIAFNTFVNGEYFFRQEDLQRQIKDYICNLPEASADPEALRLDSEVVLKAIEHHHGLLVERARNIYSFSHLTFQEYFAAREIERERHFEILMQHITDAQWKEVFILTAEMLRRSDDFLKMMKDRIDGMMANDEKLQAFLAWADQKTNSIKFNYKTVAVRAFYSYVENRALVRVLDLTLYYALARDFDFAPDFNFDPDFVYIDDAVLLPALQAFKSESQVLSNQKNFDQWWENHGKEWIEELRQLCIDRRSIGHDWQFTNEQTELLNQYYAANLLLVECMNRSYVSKQVREEIESTMLLPSKK
jgi:predicted NACHT family NTPase